jgi:hypothetical protein
MKVAVDDYLLSFSGAPRCQYALEWASSLTLPVIWTPQITNMADVNGLLSFSNHQTASPDFWRMRYVP